MVHCGGLSVWVCSQRTRIEGGESETQTQRERSAVSHGCEPLQKISPHLLFSPPPHLASIIPVFSKQLRWQWETGGQWKPRTAVPFQPPPPRLLTIGTVFCAFPGRLVRGARCAVPVAEGGAGRAGIAPWEALGRRDANPKLREALVGRRQEPAGSTWTELRCRLAEIPGITESTAPLVINVN